jgi:hypothetical protein
VKRSSRLSRGGGRVVVELLEERRLFAAGPMLTASGSLLVFNGVETGMAGAAASPVQNLSVTDTGSAPVAFSPGGISIVSDPASAAPGQDASAFAITNLGSLPSTISPGESVGLNVGFTASRVGIQTAILRIQSNDPASPIDVRVHGIGTVGLFGTNEPSLAEILRAYDIPTIVGDGPNDSNAFAGSAYPETPDPSSQEVAAPQLVKAASGPVTISALGTFDASVQPVLRFGYYTPGNPAAKTELFTVNQPNAQTVDPVLQGLTNFDPGSGPFGLYTIFPAFTDNGQLRTAYSQDSLNIYDPTFPRKFRFFPLENPDGSAVANAYIVTSEDYNTAQYNDFQDFVGIIRNVSPASGPAQAPNGLVATPVLPTQISLNWAAVPAATDYQVERKGPGDTGFVPVAQGVTATTFLDTTATPGASYSYRIRAGNPAGLSPYSAVVAITAPADLAALVSDDRTALRSAQALRTQQLGQAQQTLRTDTRAYAMALHALRVAQAAARRAHQSVGSIDPSLSVDVNRLSGLVQADKATLAMLRRTDFTGIVAGRKKLASDLVLLRKSRAHK